MVTEDYIHHRFWRIVIYSLILLVGIALLFIGTMTIIHISNLDLTKMGI
jgi:succinate dehydrogenase hydrophobic anchor subunit